MPPMGTRMAHDTGGVSSEMVSYYRERARGGVALIIVESAYVNTERPIGHLAIHSDYFIPGLNRLAEAIIEEGCLAFVQLNHRGALFGKNVNDLSKDEIFQLIKDFGKGAARAKAAGFNGFEIHSGNVYLMHQFLSPKVNQRKDEFGLTLEGRIRFPLLVFEECRKTVGDQFPIFFRLNGEEFVEGGWDVSQSQVLAKELEKRGVTAIHVTGGGFETRYWHTQPMALPRGCLVPVAARIKEVLSVPVIAVGRINDPELAETILRKHDADMVGIGRGLIADPFFPLKALRGDHESINRCVACNYCRSRVAVNNYPLRCMVNPMAGREDEFHFEEAKEKKRAWVIGGGPAGMTAATILDGRGHDVSLFEAKERLGGQLRLAVLPPYKDELKNLLDLLIRSVEKSRVRIFLHQTVTWAEIKEAMPDVVVLATGSNPVRLDLKDQSTIQKTAWEVLEEGPGKEERYLVVGGGLVGCETAEFLADRGKRVAIVEILPEIGAELEPNTRTLLMQRLGQKKVDLFPETEIERIVERKVCLRNKNNGEKTVLDIEVIVFACGSQAERGLHEKIRSLLGDVHLIGDSREPRGIAEAIFEGTKTGYRI